MQSSRSLGGREPSVEGILHNLPGVVYRCEMDHDWTMQVISDEIEVMTGYPADSFVANAVRSFASVIHPDDRERVGREVRQGLDRSGLFVIEYRLLCADGSELWVLERGRAAQLGERQVLDGLIIDITARRHAQAELRASLAEQAAEQAVTEERVRISREIHDSVGHALSVVVLQAGAAATALPEQPGDAVGPVSAIREVATDTLTEMDRLLALLHGDAEETVAGRGLRDVSRLVERVRAAGVAIELEFDGRAQGIARETDAVAFRVVQEGITNALKHAQGAAVQVSVRFEGESVDVLVRNRGQRWDPQSLPSHGSSRGLDGLRGRVRELGGDLRAAAQDDGFELRAHLPPLPDAVLRGPEPRARSSAR